MEIYRYFNVDFSEASDKHVDDLKAVLGHVSKGRPMMPGDLIQKLEELQVRLGQPHVGESRLSQMAQYSRIKRTMRDLNKQMEVMERGIGGF